MQRLIQYLTLLVLSVFLFFPIWVIHLFFRRASNDATWKTQYSKLPQVDLQDDEIRIHNVRDFRYNSDKSIKTENYLSETYYLSKMQKVWYAISHFGPNGLAHVLLSFQFNDGKYLVVSIEARLKEKHLGYNALRGLFGTYTKTIVLATEQDVIGLRTHIRKERVYLYPLDISELYTKALLLNYLGRAQSLNVKPAFYNSILDNCMTGLLEESLDYGGIVSWMDRRILLPGYSDELAYENGFIDTTIPFDDLKLGALVKPEDYNIDDEDFSKKLRNS